MLLFIVVSAKACDASALRRKEAYSAPLFRAKALSMVPSLAAVSIHSDCGVEAATMPAGEQPPGCRATGRCG